MSVRLEAAPDRGFKIRTVRPKSRHMATLVYICSILIFYIMVKNHGSFE